MDKQLAWELEWIDQHAHQYDSPMHAEAVKRNIEKRYQLASIEKRIRAMLSPHKPKTEQRLINEPSQMEAMLQNWKEIWDELYLPKDKES